MRSGLVILALALSGLWLSDEAASFGGPASDAVVAGQSVFLDVEAADVFVAAALDSSQAIPTANAVEMALLDRTNAERASRGLGPVGFDPELLEVARVRAAAQVGQPSLSHYDGAGQLAFSSLLRDFGLVYHLAGENLARLSGPELGVASRAHVALMNSPTHRENILEPTFDSLAVGSATDSNGRIIFAQIFRAGSPSS